MVITVGSVVVPVLVSIYVVMAGMIWCYFTLKKFPEEEVPKGLYLSTDKVTLSALTWPVSLLSLGLIKGVKAFNGSLKRERIEQEYQKAIEDFSASEFDRELKRSQLKGGSTSSEKMKQHLNNALKNIEDEKIRTLCVIEIYHDDNVKSHVTGAISDVEELTSLSKKLIEKDKSHEGKETKKPQGKLPVYREWK